MPTVQTYQSRNVVFNRLWVEGVLASYVTPDADPLLAAIKCHLNTDPAYSPTPDSTLDQLEAAEANYQGYTAGGTAMTMAVRNLTPVVQGLGGAVTFMQGASTPSTPNTVYGYWVSATSLGAETWIFAEAFPSETTAGFTNFGDFLTIIANLPWALQQLAGSFA